ncbi:hypothetical protein [Microbacterium sp.]|uniref:hypothetical protein n=1 Tax=Microbacterium sp. TaxID=51671 RepID=UPI003221555D
MNRRRLAHGDVTHPHRGVYVAAMPEQGYERCLAAVPLLGDRRWFSHVTAARLWGIPLPFDAAGDDPLHVLALPGAEPIRRPGFVGWETAAPPERVIHAGLPIIAPAAVWAQLCVPGATGQDRTTGRRLALSQEWLVVAGDFLLTGPRTAGRRTPLCTLDDLVDAVWAHRGKRGAKALTCALAQVRRGPQSPRESLLRLALVACGLPEPAVQPAVLTAAGIRHPDLGYLEARVLIEYQGDHHRTDRRQWREDLVRRQLFEDAGHRVIEVAADVFDDGCHALAQRVRRALLRV